LPVINLAQAGSLCYCSIVEPSRRGVTAIVLLVLVTSVALWAVLSRPVTAKAKEWVTGTLLSLAGPYQESTGLTLSYASLSPRLFGRFELRGIQVQAGEVELLHISRLVVRYDRTAALGGRFVLLKISLSDLDLSIDLERDSAVLERLQTSLQAMALRIRPSGRDFRMELSRASFALKGLDGLDLVSSIRRSDILVEGGKALSFSAAGNIAVNDHRGRLGTTTASAPFAVSARLLNDLSRAEALLRLSVDSDIGRMDSMEYSLSLESGIVTASTSGKGLRQLDARWYLAERRLELAMVLDGFVPFSIASSGMVDDRFRPWLGLPYWGTLGLSSDLSTAGTNVSMDLSGRAPLELPGGHPRFRLAGTGTIQSINVETARLWTPVFDLSFSGAIKPLDLAAQGKVSGFYILRPGLEFSGELGIQGAANSWFAYAESLDISGSSLYDLSTSVFMDNGSIEYFLEATTGRYDSPYGDTGGIALSATDEFVFEGVEALTPADRAGITVEGTLVLGDDAYLEAGLRLDKFSLGSFRELLGSILGQNAVSILSPLRLDGDISIFSDFSQLSYTSVNTLIVHEGLSSAFGVASFSGTSDYLEISNLDASVNGYALNGSVSIDYSSPAGLGYTIGLVMQEIPYRFSGTIYGDSLFMSGDYGFSLSVRGLGGELLARFGFENLPVQTPDVVLALGLRSTARFAGFDNWDLVVDRASVEPASSGTSRIPAISLTGAFDQAGGRISRLGIVDAVSSLEGAADVTWDYQDGLRVAVKGLMEALDGESYAVDGEYRDGELAVLVGIARAQMARLPVRIKGRFDASLRVTGPIRDPAADFSFALNEGSRLRELPVASGQGSYAAGTLTITNAKGRFLAQSMDNATGTYNIDDRQLTGSARAFLAVGTHRYEGSIAFNGQARVNEAGAAEDYVVNGTMAGFAFGPETNQWPFELVLTDDQRFFRAGPEDQAKLSFSTAGELSARLAPGLPLSLSAEGRIAEGAISLELRQVRVQMPFLFQLLRLPFVEAISGTASGDLTLAGRIGDPEINGTVDFDNVYLGVPEFVSAPIGPFTQPLYFTGRNMETLQSDLKCGDARLSANLVATFRGYIPSELDITVQSTGPGFVPVQMKLLGMDIGGFAQPTLLIELDDGQARLSGSVMVPTGDIILTTDLVTGAANEGNGDASNFSLDLDLSFGRGVRLYFPDKRLPLIYGQADPSSRLSVSFDGSTDSFELNGQAALRGGTVFYIQKNFYLKNATVVFDEDETSFDPVISLEAETRSRNESGSVLVLLSARNSRLSDLSFRLESVPGMSEAEIARLLGMDLLAVREGETPELGRVIIENTDLLPQLNIISVFERNVQELLGLDLFFVRSQILQRWLYDLSGLAGSDTTASLADYLENTAVIGGKYIRDDLFFQVAFRLQEPPLAEAGDLRLNSEIGLEWVTPHFVLNWRFQPENPDTLFVTDQSFSLFWRIPLK
jgi:translocation and assembly module TamB